MLLNFLLLVTAFQQEKFDSIPDLVAKESIKQGKEAWKYYQETKNEKKLSGFEQLATLSNSGPRAIRKDKDGVFKFSTKAPEGLKTRAEMNERILHNLEEFANGNLLYAPEMNFFTDQAIGYLGGSTYESCKVLQVIGKGTMLISIRQKIFKDISFTTLMVKGVDTTKFVDGEDFYYDMLFAVVGTQSYTTALGSSKKVHVLEVVSQEEMKLAAEKVKKEFGVFWQKEKQEEQKTKELADQMEKEAERNRMEKKKDSESKAAIKKGRESATKLIKGLENYAKRFKEASKETNESVANQMRSQALTYIGNGDKRLAEAIKDVQASGLSEEEKNKLINDARDALKSAKKTVGLP